jgi:hypothetical protein
MYVPWKRPPKEKRRVAIFAIDLGSGSLRVAVLSTLRADLGRVR